MSLKKFKNAMRLTIAVLEYIEIGRSSNLKAGFRNNKTLFALKNKFIWLIFGSICLVYCRPCSKSRLQKKETKGASRERKES
jgi:hypothetical protein